MEEKMKVDEVKFKILHLLDNIEIEQRTAVFLADRLKISENIAKNHLKILVSRGLLKTGSDRQGVKRYFLADFIKKRVNEVVEGPPCC